MQNLIQARKIAGGIAIATLGFVLGGAAFAQSPGDGSSGKANNGSQSGSNLSDVKITLNIEQEDVLDALRALMKSAKADFSIDDDLKEGTVTVHLKDVPFKDALATVMKVSTLPITYELKDGIYHFKRRPETPPDEDKTPGDPEPGKPAPHRPIVEKIPLKNISADKAVRALNGDVDPPPQPLYFHSYNPAGGGGSVSFFGFNNGQVSSAGGYTNPNGTISRTGGNTLNLLNLLGGIFGRGRH